MKKTIYIVIVLLCLGCNENTKTQAEIDKISLDSTHTLEAEYPASVNSKDAIDDPKAPIKIFIEFTAKLNDEGWFFDHDRFLKLSSYSNLSKANELKYFDDRPFYKIAYKATDVYDAKKFTRGDSEHFESYNFELDNDIIGIWAYFYRAKKVNNSIEDGIIEQWSFVSKEKATQFYNQTNKVAGLIYFNTAPYLVQHENYVFIFHTRAMAFSTAQKKVFNMFKDNLLISND